MQVLTTEDTRRQISRKNVRVPRKLTDKNTIIVYYAASEVSQQMFAKSEVCTHRIWKFERSREKSNFLTISKLRYSVLRELRRN